MHPVYTKDNFNHEIFHHDILKTCLRHKNDGRALAFAFIVYDYKSPAIQKILQDGYYFNTLNKTSGKYLTIFYLLPDDKEEGDRIQPIQWITSLSVTSKGFDDYNDFFNDNFETGYGSKPPYILFFQIEGDEISDYFAVFLKEKKFEETFIEIQTQIESAANCLAKINPNFYHNSKEIFEQLETSVQGANIRSSIKGNLKKLNLFATIKFILGLF